MTNEIPLLNVLVVNASSKISRAGADSFIKKHYKIRKVTPDFIKNVVHPEVFEYNWNEFCNINEIDKNHIFSRIETTLQEGEGFSAQERKQLIRHTKNESVGRIGADKVKKMKAERAKIEGGYKCEVCGFSFSEHYGNLGQDFIELHHLPMYKNMKHNSKRNLTEKDFAILCSNCHRMIHRLPKPQNSKADLQTLKDLYKNF